MDSLFFIDFNSISFGLELFNYLNYNSYMNILNNNYILFNIFMLVIIVYPLVSKYYLLNSLKNLVNNIYLLIQKKEIEYYYLNEHLLYNIFFWVNKKSFIRLTFRLFEVQKDNKEKYKHRKIYILWQYIDYFYLKIILDYFYSLTLRIFYFSFIFIIKYIFYIIQVVMFKLIFKLKLYNIFNYNFIFIVTYVLNLGQDIFYKIYSVVNYYKLELFVYVNNENNFFAGLFFFFFNSLYYKIPIFNNNNVWKSRKLPHVNSVSKFFNNWKIITNYIYIWNNKIYKSILSNISYFIKIYIYFIVSVEYIKKIIYFFFRFSNIISFNRKEAINFNYVYLSLGFLYYFILDLFKNLICFVLIKTKQLIIKFKYFIFIYLLYKLGFIYILYISFIFFLTNCLENNIDIMLYNSISTIYDFYDIMGGFTLIDTNEGLCAAWTYEYNELLIRKKFYKYHTIIGKLTLLSLRTIDLNSFNFTSLYDSSKILKSSVLMYTWKKYFSNILDVIYMEITSFLILKYHFFMYNNINLYNIYLYYISDINMAWYFFKKISNIFYILNIFLLMYLKYLYFYIIPYYFLLTTVFNVYFIYNKIWYILLCFYDIYIIFYSVYIDILYYILFKLSISVLVLLFFIKSISYYIYIQFILLYIVFNEICGLVQYYMFLNIYDVYINFIINKYMLVCKFKEIIISYLRLDLFNLINFRYNDNNIIGNKVISHTQFNLEEIDFKKLKKSGLTEAQMEEAIIQDKLYIRHPDVFSYVNKLFIFNNMYYLSDNYTLNEFHWDLLHLKDFWVFNIYIKNIIFYYVIDLYIIIYLIFFMLFKLLFNLSIFKSNNVNYLWYDLKKKLNYKALNNDKFFLKALYYHQKIHSKIKIISKIYNFLDLSWSTINKIKVNDLKFKLFKLNLHNINVGIKNSYLYNNLNDGNLKNFLIEKNMYYNNFYKFYWKNLIIFNQYNINNNFIENYEDGKNYNILNFFLSLIFKKTKNSSLIFFYFENSNKNFYWNNSYNKYFNRTNNIMFNYFQKIENWLNLFKNEGLLNKDSSLILFKDEDANFSDMYSLNFNVIIPKYFFEFYWVGFLMYILIFKFRYKYIHMFDLYSSCIRIAFIKSILINNNFMYLYDILLYWYNYIFMFDVKNMSYEQIDYKRSLIKTKRYYKLIRPSNLFIINNDPLYFLKKNYTYHMIFNHNVYYDFLLSTKNLSYLIYVKYWLNLIIFIVCYKNLFKNYNNNIVNIYSFINILNIYKINLIKYYNYILKEKKEIKKNKKK